MEYIIASAAIFAVWAAAYKLCKTAAWRRIWAWAMAGLVIMLFWQVFGHSYRLARIVSDFGGL